MKNIFLLIFVLFITLTTKAQSDNLDTIYIENLKELNSRPLKVVLKKGKSESTKQFNKNYKAAILNEWKITEDIEFITEEVFKTHKKNKNSKFAYLHPDKVRSSGGSRPGNKSGAITPGYDALFYLALDVKKEIIVSNIPFGFKKKHHKALYFEAVQRLYYEILDDIDNKNSIEDDILEIYKNGTKEELKVYAIKIAAKAKEDLKTMTLLIDKKLLKKNVSSLIIKYYPYDYKIVSEITINNAVVANDKTKAYLTKYKITDIYSGK
ncbi:hypothetical protein [Lacinutrix jangbogonensis]|uniref:hypothetical protein n=1 Tax=Lacinutrix jangbogonensis TaxID=1469557 RepID=UPI00053E1638|nr:hypothetical protein [Lacinutrix jangbogonensis]